MGKRSKEDPFMWPEQLGLGTGSEHNHCQSTTLQYKIKIKFKNEQTSRGLEENPEMFSKHTINSEDFKPIDFDKIKEFKKQIIK